jgi:hypothetical protein
VTVTGPDDRAVASTHVFGVSRFERLFRTAAGLDIDKADLKRYTDFLNRRIYGLLARGVETAQINGRRAVEPVDLPITEGLRQCIRDFKGIDETFDLKPILDHLAARPPLDLVNSAATETMLPEIAGGLSVALARSFKIIDPDLKNPQSKHWQSAGEVFDLLV